jgi:uncharacterized membrane protein
MKRFNNFIRQSIVGGFLVILPVVVLFFCFRWAINTVRDLIHPLAAPLALRSGAPDYIVDLFIILLILAACFIIGTIVTTSGGKWIHVRFDKSLAKLAPGYNLVRDIIQQVLGDNENSPFKRGEVARIQLFGVDVPTEVTGIVTSYHANGWYTVFIPTGPNPTSGMIYHLPANQVTVLPHIKVDEAFRSIIACGAGSGEMFAKPSH